MKFSELGLRPEILEGLKEMGYSDLTPVQEQTFPHVLAGRDLIARAETGSGKTSACGIPLVQAVDEELNAVQALIVLPTRELALQYVSELARISEKTRIAPFAVYGGFSMETQKAKLNHGVHILVATPGRLIDLLRRSTLSLSQVRTFVLDEADEMLKMGFIDDVEYIFSCLIHEHQTLLFSATMPDTIKRLAKKYLKDPLTIELNTQVVAPENLEHHFNPVAPKRKFEALLAYLKDVQPVQAILFCNSRNNGERLYDKLRDKLEGVEIIHGGLEQSRRTSLFNRFKKQGVRFMIATDVASRGLDFQHVSHVINYDFPNGPDAYTHRTGRTARMGRKGVAMTFYSHHDLGAMKMLIDTNHIKPTWLGEEPDLRHVRQRKSSGPYRGRRGQGGNRPRRKSSRPRR